MKVARARACVRRDELRSARPRRVNLSWILLAEEPEMTRSAFAILTDRPLVARLETDHEAVRRPAGRALIDDEYPSWCRMRLIVACLLALTAARNDRLWAETLTLVDGAVLVVAALVTGPTAAESWELLPAESVAVTSTSMVSPMSAPVSL